MHNLGQSDSDLFANYTYTKIVIILAMSTDLLGRQYDLVMQPVRRGPEQLPYCRVVSFGHSPLLNYEDLACPIDKVMQSN